MPRAAVPSVPAQTSIRQALGKVNPLLRLDRGLSPRRPQRTPRSAENTLGVQPCQSSGRRAENVEHRGNYVWCPPPSTNGTGFTRRAGAAKRLRHRTNLKARGAADWRARSAVGRMPLLASLTAGVNHCASNGPRCMLPCPLASRKENRRRTFASRQTPPRSPASLPNARFAGGGTRSSGSTR